MDKTKLLGFFLFFAITLFSFGSEGEKVLRGTILQDYSLNSIENFTDDGNMFAVNFPNSYFNAYLLFLKGKLYFQNKDYKNSRDSLKLFLVNNKISDYMTEEALLMLCTIELQPKKTSEDSSYDVIKYFDRLADIDFKYLKMKGIFYFKNISREKGSDYLEDYTRVIYDKEVAIILGDYFYESKKYEKACQYYLNSDLAKYLNAAIILNDYKKVEKISLLLQNNDDKAKAANTMKEIKAKFEDRDKAKKYYEIADKNFSENKLDISKYYYKKIVEEIKDISLKENAIFNIGKIAYLNKNYPESNDYFTRFLGYNNIKKNCEVYYYLGLNSFNNKELDKAKVFFDKIILDYPFTFWETKAKIYSLKIKK